MSDNVLMEMTIEKNRMIGEVIAKFLGHEPTPEERKQFNVMNRLGESIIYFKGDLVGTIKYKTIDDKISYDTPDIQFF